MNYYTSYKLEIRDEITFAKAEEILENLNKKIGWEIFILEAEDEDINPSEIDYWDVYTIDATWYDWGKDMLELSKEFPDVLFGLEGRGEERRDWWYALFKDGTTTTNYCEPPSTVW